MNASRSADFYEESEEAGGTAEATTAARQVVVVTQLQRQSDAVEHRVPYSGDSSLSVTVV